jgi:hypothetical protein
MKNNIKLLLLFAALGLQTTNSYAPEEIMADDYSDMSTDQLAEEQTKLEEEAQASEEAYQNELNNPEATKQSLDTAKQASSDAQAQVSAFTDAVNGMTNTTGLETSVFDNNYYDNDSATEDIGEDGLTDSERGRPEVTTPAVAEAVAVTSTEAEGLPQATVTVIEGVADSFVEGSTTPTTVENGVSEVVSAKGDPLAKIKAFFKMIGEGFAGLFEMIGDAFSNIGKKSSSESSSSSSTIEKSFAEIESLSDEQIENLKSATITTAEDAQSFFNLQDGYTETDLTNAMDNDALSKANFESITEDKDSSIQENITKAYNLLVEDAVPEGMTWIEGDEDESEDDDTTPEANQLQVGGGWNSVLDF